jgi:hypothetical protein
MCKQAKELRYVVAHEQGILVFLTRFTPFPLSLKTPHNSHPNLRRNTGRREVKRRITNRTSEGWNSLTK